ncbi:MAG: hypothetical protein IJX26_00165 [Clostridia bacterium]|nr:hypothetical protein [Clostridia bacterium]
MKKFQDYLKEGNLILKILTSNNFRNSVINKCYITSNEFLAKYLSKINFKNKRVATVGSSGDQVLNALYYGSKDVTLIDGNVYSQAFIEYKMTLIKIYSFNTATKLLATDKIFDFRIFKKVEPFLSPVVKDFWSVLIQNETQNKKVHDEENDDKSLFYTLTQDFFNKYSEFFENEKAYNKLKDILLKEDFIVNYIISDISEFAENLNGKYDIILLSNIYKYVQRPESKKRAFFETIKKLYNNHLNNNGTIQVTYNYNTYLPETDLRKEFNVRVEEIENETGVNHRVYFIDKPAHQTDEEHNILF